MKTPVLAIQIYIDNFKNLSLLNENAVTRVGDWAAPGYLFC